MLPSAHRGCLNSPTIWRPDLNRHQRTADDTRTLFDTWAASYGRDLAAADGILAGYQESLCTAASLVTLPRGAEVLDIGVGTGAFATLVAAHQLELRITGIDPSPEMLRICATQHPDWQLERGSFEWLPARSNDFGCIISAFAFHEVAPKSRATALRAVIQHPAPGGVFCLLDIAFASPEALTAARHDLGETWDPTETYHLIADLDQDLRSAGCTDVVWRHTARCHWAALARRGTR